MATHSSILAWRIPWTEEPGGLQSLGTQRIGYDWSDLACTHNISIRLHINKTNKTGRSQKDHEGNALAIIYKYNYCSWTLTFGETWRVKQLCIWRESRPVLLEIQMGEEGPREILPRVSSGENWRTRLSGSPWWLGNKVKMRKECCTLHVHCLPI